MKRFALITLILACAGFISSCSKQTESAGIEESVAYEQLSKSLEEYNTEFLNSTETKSFWSSLCRIVTNDAIGALLGSSAFGPGGGLFGAVAASTARFVTEIIETHLDSGNAEELNSFFNRDTCLYDDLSLNEADSIGIYHNQIIVAMLDERPDIASMSETEINDLIICKMSEAGQGLLSTAVADYKFYSALNDDENSEALFNRISKRYPSINRELQIVKKYADTIANIEEDEIPSYTDGYRAIVNDSDISEDSKDLVISTISVAGSSKLLWEEDSLPAR